MTDTIYDLSDASEFEAETRLGQFVRAAVADEGGCVVLRRGDHLSFLPLGKVLRTIPITTLANLLLEAGWGDEDILSVLSPIAQAGPA